jgi:hypothetical protein
MFEEFPAPPLSANQDPPPDWPVLLTRAEAPKPDEPYSTYSWTVLVAVRGGLWRPGIAWAWTWSWSTADWRCQVDVLGLVRWYCYDHRYLRKVIRLAPPRSPASVTTLRADRRPELPSP